AEEVSARFSIDVCCGRVAMPGRFVFGGSLFRRAWEPGAFRSSSGAKAGIPLPAVIPAKAGIHFDLACLSAFSRKPTHVRVLYVDHPWSPVTFFCLPKRKVTKEKGTLAAAVTRASMPA